MSLEINPQKYTSLYSTGQSRDCLNMYIYDNTGAYNGSTNPTGYGAPNPTYLDIDQITLRVYQPNVTDTYEDIILNGGTTPTAVAYANPSGGQYYTLTSINTGQSTSSEVLTDGVWVIYEYVCYNLSSGGANTVDCTNGSSTVTKNAGTPFADMSAGLYFWGPDGEFYLIESIGATTITLTTAYAGSDVTNSSTFGVSYKGTLNASAMCNSNACMTTILAANYINKSTQVCSSCQQKGETLASAAFIDYMQLEAMDAKENYSSLQTAIDIYQQKYCDSNNDCGCQ